MIILTAGAGRSDPVIAGNILDPKTAGEAWNVIKLATNNVEKLLQENRLAEIPVQASYCSPALRALPGMVAIPDASGVMRTQISRAFMSVNAIAAAAKENNPVGARSALAAFRGALGQVAQQFEPKVVETDIFFCPMHPDFLSENSQTPCAKCGMSLLVRRIPYSFVYTKPGEPTVRMTARAGAALAAGVKAELTLHLAKLDGSPVLYADLIEMHTERIHLLIEEPGLGDYHHVHPVPGTTPGEYSFSFIPGKTTPYRIWADLVPTATGVQELPFIDLPSTGKAGAIHDTVNRFTAAAGGYHFALSFTNGNLHPTKAGEARKMEIVVTGQGGQPVTALEPVMNAFAHLVGFYDDYRTVVHLHPTGGDVLNPELRGGPTLGFILFAPKAGFMRLYCQVSIGGVMLFAPFNLNVEP